MTDLLKRAARIAFHRGGGLELARWRTRGALRILMYHRFSDRAALARQCDYLRERYHPVAMSDVAEWLQGGRNLPSYAVAVTVDDGYRDFEQVAFPVFAEYRIPVTVYLVTDFMDGKLWLWFDRVQYVFRHAQAASAAIDVPGGPALHFDLGSVSSRSAAGQQVADLAATFSEADRLRLVSDLPGLLHVEIPEEPPPDYQPLSWDAVRALAASGVEFGAHTRTHPILSALASADELRDEIAGSQARIAAELGKPVIHFCYPNGKMRDIGSAAVEAVRAAGFQTAVTAEPGLNRAGQDALLLRRTGADPSHPETYFRQCLTGFSG